MGMVDQKCDLWNWEVSGYEPRKPFELEDHRPVRLLHRCSMPFPPFSPYSEARKIALASKFEKLKDTVKIAKEDCLKLRQEAIDLQEYSNAKLDRVTRYLGSLADKTYKLDQVVIEAESKISPLKNETKRLFNELLTIKGKINFFCRVRPLFEDEGTSVVEFPDDCTVRIITGDDIGSNVKKDFEFDRVYGPHVGQVELFNDIQPFVQSALDGYNVSVFAYGQTGSGKTHTMEGSNHERGLYARCFEELFDLSNSDSTLTSQFDFFVTVFELYNEQIRDLLSESTMGSLDSPTELTQRKVDNPMVFSGVLKSAFHNRGTDVSKFNVSHLVTTIHVYYQNTITGENMNSKLSLVDLAASDCLITEYETGERITDLLHVMKSLSALGDVLWSLTSNKDVVPYENSVLTRVISDSLGGSSKTLMIVNICPNLANMSDTISSLNFSARSRNTVLSLGNRDTIKKWRDVANESRKELYQKENEIHNLKQQILGLKQELKGANDQGVLLFNEVQKAWKVSYTMQSDLKSENVMLAEKLKMEEDQNTNLQSQVAKLLLLEQDQIIQTQQQASVLQNLEAKLKNTELQLSDACCSNDGMTASEQMDCRATSIFKATAENTDSSAVTRKFEGELLKRDALIERLHEENEKLFDRLTEKETVAGSPQLSGPSSKGFSRPQKLGSLPVTAENENMVALVNSNPENVKTTPAGEYLTASLYEFNPEQYDSLATISDGANKLLMLVLAAVIKAGASREHEILAEIRDAVFLFIRKMEPRRVLDTMLVSRVRILYIRSFLAKFPELRSIKVPSIQHFLEKPNAGHSRASSRGNSPGRSPASNDSSRRNSLGDEQIQGFKVNIKQEKKSKLSLVVLKIRGIDQETWRQHVTGGKLREITEDAKSFATGNKSLAALFVHTPAGELQRQIRSWLAENFEFLSITGDDSAEGTTGQLELLSTAIMDGWMAGLGAALSPNTDALGQLLFVYSRRVYASQLQHLKDIAGTLAAEEAADSSSVSKLRSALTSVDHERRRILQQMKSDIALQTLEDGGPPISNLCTAAEDARLASLISLDEIVKQVKDILRQTSVSSVSINRKRAMLGSLDELEERMPSLLEIDHPCAKRQIADARSAVEAIREQEGSDSSESASATREVNVAQWNVLQFNTGTTSPFIIKCGANSNSELVIKSDARVEEPKGGEIVRVVPRPGELENMGLDDLKNLFSQLPEALSLLALARTADGTRARYSRLYRTLAMKVPSLRDLVGELEREGALKDAR